MFRFIPGAVLKSLAVAAIAVAATTGVAAQPLPILVPCSVRDAVVDISWASNLASSAGALASPLAADPGNLRRQERPLVSTVVIG